MRVDLHASVRTHDGDDVGHVARAIVDPDSKEVSDFVVNTGSFLGRDVLVPRERVTTLSLGASEEEILEVCRESAHTRMPVWDGSPDNIVGIVNTKDLFAIFSLKGIIILMDAMYAPIFVAPEAPVARVLQTLRRAKRAMTVVRSSDGRFLGIITLEDILEEIVGEIEDEHD